MSDFDGRDIDALPEIATLIGNLCQEWADLEYGVQMLFAILSGMRRDKETLAILRCLDFRDVMTAIKVAAVARIKDHAFVDEIIETIDHIDNALRPRRNRLVHDRWEETGDWDRAIRIAAKPKLQRPQAHQPRAILEDRSDETISDVVRTFRETAAYSRYVRSLALAVPDENPMRPRLLAERPPRPFPHPQAGKPSQSRNDA